MENNKTIELSNFDGHLILLCKGHYFKPINNISIFRAFRLLWAIRCGHPVPEENDKGADEYIADKMYEIIVKLKRQDYLDFQKRLHRELSSTYDYRYEGLSNLERLLLVYRSEIMMLQIKEKKGKRYKAIIKLPKPEKRVFNRILKGKGRYEGAEIFNDKKN